MSDSGVIGPYRVLAPIGRGGMGVVYLATHVDSGARVALKTAHEAAAHWFDGIRNEIRALSHIRHPGVVCLLDHGEHLGRPWYAMELLAGQTLATLCGHVWGRTSDVVPAGRLGNGQSAQFLELQAGSTYARGRSIGVSRATPEAVRQLLCLMRRVCATLAYLHGEGFVSRDLKPDNIMLRGDLPVLIDFGLSAAHPGGSGREAPQLQPRGGSLLYTSPEQLRGELVDARADLYAIGCILYELVTGRPPFSGTPAVVVHQHLTGRPLPPSQIVLELPEALNRLILRLLEKEPAKRYGYADEVAARLAEITDEAGALSDFPLPRPYLYRPAFVGREPILRELAALRDRLTERRGACVLLGGVSGAGKTRLAMELARDHDWSSWTVVITEVQPPVRDSHAEVIGPSPLALLRPLLRAVADCCQAGGAELSEALVGDRAGVLAVYEPLLEHIPRVRPPEPDLPLPPAAARNRLFEYLGYTLARFAAHHPVFWLIDDVGWADELSLEFLARLPQSVFESTGLFLLGTFRSEEPAPALDALRARSHVQVFELERLPEAAVASMAADMLAAASSAASLAPALAELTHGNPFFVAEYLRAAIHDAVLSRDVHGGWQLSPLAHAAVGGQPRLGLPGSLRELLERRIQRLSPLAQAVVETIAVLGRECDTRVLCEVAELGEDELAEALDELQRRYILEARAAHAVKFAHDQLREAVYARLGARRSELHLLTARVLERRLLAAPQQTDDSLVTLGQHFAAARASEPAARYLERAASRARATHANVDALRLYNEAIAQAERTAERAPGQDAWPALLAGMYESKGDLSSLAAQRAAARAAYQSALDRSAPGAGSQRARVLRKLGKTWESEHQHAQALRCYDDALASIGADPKALDAAARDEWIQVHIERIWVHYFRAETERMARDIDLLTPVVTRHGSPSQRVRYLQSAVQLALRTNRYVVDEQTLSYSRSALETIADRPDLPEYPMVQFNLGFALLLNLSLPGAERALETALQSARRVGDATHETRCLTYLSIVARMLGKTSDVERHTAETERVGVASGMIEYFGTALANRAWLALQDGALTLARSNAERALECWAALPVVYPFQWLALIPLLSIQLREGAMAEAPNCIERLLAPTQQILPGGGCDALTLAQRSFAGGRLDEAANAIGNALHELMIHGYR